MTGIVLDNATRVKRAMEWIGRSMTALNACMAVDELDAGELEQVAIAVGAIAQSAHGAWFRRMLADAGADQLAAIVEEASAAGMAAAESAVEQLRRPHAVPDPRGGPPGGVV